MLQVYTTPNCSSCKKVKRYFQKYHINYTEKNIFSNPLTREDVFKMLRYSENGFEDIISLRSKIIKEQNIDINSMKTSELVDFIIKNPSVLKRPIILSELDMQIGYNDDDITLFLPDELRDSECSDCNQSTKESDNCGLIDALEYLKKRNG